jgi:hypothetical protein
MLALVAAVACRRSVLPRAFDVPGDHGPAVTVEVLNASGKSGLARTGTRVLRSAGIDVVNYFTAPGDVGTLDSTRILVRRGGESAGQVVRKALRLGSVMLRPDSSRLVDVSVLLGADFAARAFVELHP